jgi:trk system potassium uptake protein TrkA
MGIGRGIRTVLPRGQERLHKNDQIFALARPKHIPHIARILGKSASRIDSVMILGGTKVGMRVAAQLSGVRHMSLKLVEPDRTIATQLAETLEGVLVIHGDVADLDLLVAEGLGEMDAFVAVTNDEESNLVSCLMAKHLGVQKTVALLSKGGYVPISQAIGLDAAVSTKLAVSREVLRFLRGKHVMSVATVYGLDLEVLEMIAEVRSPITRKPLKELSLPAGILVGAVLHGRDVDVATGDTEIEAGDRVITFVLPARISELERLFSK